MFFYCRIFRKRFGKTYTTNSIRLTYIPDFQCFSLEKYAINNLHNIYVD